MVFNDKYKLWSTRFATVDAAQTPSKHIIHNDANTRRDKLDAIRAHIIDNVQITNSIS